jgi:hypothetical protein
MALHDLTPKLHRVRLLAWRHVSLGGETDPILYTLVRVRSHLRLGQPREAERLLDVLLARLQQGDTASGDIASMVRRDSAA